MPLVLLWIVVAALVTAAGVPSVHQTAGALRLELWVGKASYVVGEPVQAHLAARNGGRTPLRVEFASGQRFDLVVRQRGVLVWRWSHDRAFVQVLQEVTLRPGQALTFEATWGQIDLQGRRVEPGTYELVGVFLGRTSQAGMLETPPLLLRITP
ncbi:MAG: BsuPI-related putative proteinase inhibitor [Armatimonadota bacterium]|nr:BsuPI-related putative proteinase inhibitor [Armatimonadota bacterium]MDR7427295.1 BsuPI-related putative proteinase inhibitor [Armatimonadota bacterium]MDR7464851.1 BsuPI-related putative proteinase inhibitor [Armatimonadota bacterium]MDR7469917.1 BsuPI-related putative proteinase inhibitor [Armatimonadota bacterium]MDR7474602.1 BsuPI-related putative proteinase inhibitor [Armatimonadota bacterium]